jgi:hypothetical protein
MIDANKSDLRIRVINNDKNNKVKWAVTTTLLQKIHIIT